jgi:hypothetical protein
MTELCIYDSKILKDVNNDCNFVNALAGENVKSAEENEFKYVVSILEIDNSTLVPIEMYHRCTGTLVSKQDVLTAEHCVNNIFPSAIKMLIGSIDLRLGTIFSPLFFVPYIPERYEHDVEYQNRDKNVNIFYFVCI